jgi:hypothetical protein
VRSITQFYGGTPPLSSLLRSRCPPWGARRRFEIQYRTTAKFLGKKHKTHFPASEDHEVFNLVSPPFKTGLVKFLTRIMVMFQVSAGVLHILNNMEQTKGKFNSTIKSLEGFNVFL